MGSKPKTTPMMAQYRRIKTDLPEGTFLLFRLGDFYEMFFEDAQRGAPILNVALTKRGMIPMCGIPYHAASTYISKLLTAGNKVAICDQVEEARPGKLVKRGVTQILSPGTHFDDRMLQAERNNYLAAISRCGKSIGLAVVDLTTSDFRTTEVSDDASLLTELECLRPAELVIPSEDQSLADRVGSLVPLVTPYEDWVFAPETARFTLSEHFQVASLDGFGLKNHEAALGAAGAVLHYLTHYLRREVPHLTRISFYQRSEFLVLDAVSLRHLEILEPRHADAPKPRSLYEAVNRTVTPMGARRLRDWLTQPLASARAIVRRQDAVEAFLNEAVVLEEIRDRLKAIRDLERTINRLSVGSGNARDLQALRLALSQTPTVRDFLSSLNTGPAPSDADLIREETAAAESSEPSLLENLAGQLSDLPELVEAIGHAIVDEPPIALKEGGLIRDGYDSALDELRSAARDGKAWIARLQQEESERTGIPSLKIRFNSVFGYYIEVTRSNLDKVPEHYVRKQTIANGERFITPELKEMEGKILGAEERSERMEYELFQRVRETAIEHLRSIQLTAAALAQLDVLAAFAETSRFHSYCRPIVGEEGVLHIEEGRHPVLDQSLTEARFVPNDVDLNTHEQQIMLITGPNMAGKSTYIRQVALLTLLAHTGCFVPANQARIDLTDRIFTRIGASDDLARGQSTFMVEMSETANILNHATKNSLIVLDEIGRGTSTFDGLSLAWSIVEHLHHQVGAKTLFATHYHELTELSGRLARCRNYNVAVREWKDEIVFLRKILPGGTDKSYGIQVARLAGVPRPVIDRAKVILRNLEESELTPEGNIRQTSRHRAERAKLQELEPPPQLDLFGG